MENAITFQRLKKEYRDRFALAEGYYLLLFSLNNIHLTERELQLIAFSAIKGNLSSANVREEFCKIYNTSFPTISNMISRLRKLNIVIKEDRKIKINPRIILNFEKDVILEIKLLYGQTNNPVN